MCNIESFYDLYSWYYKISSNETNIIDIKCNPPGSLGVYLTFEELQKAGIHDICIGSISLKYVIDKKKISILLFTKSHMIN